MAEASEIQRKGREMTRLLPLLAAVLLCGCDQRPQQVNVTVTNSAVMRVVDVYVTNIITITNYVDRLRPLPVTIEHFYLDEWASNKMTATVILDGDIYFQSSNIVGSNITVDIETNGITINGHYDMTNK
jgi:hypothetical protein